MQLFPKGKGSSLSLIYRVSIGFVVILLLVVGITVTALSNQRSQTDQINLLTAEVVPLLTHVNAMILATQNANKAVSQHSANTDPEILALLEDEFQQSRTQYQTLQTEIRGKTALDPELVALMDAADGFAQRIFTEGELHLKLQRDLLATQKAYRANYTRYGEQWQNFNDDLRVLNRVVEILGGDSGDNYDPATSGRIQYFIDKLASFRTLLTGLNNVTSVAELREMVESATQDIGIVTDSLEDIEVGSEIAYELASPYWEVIVHAFTDETGVVPLYMRLLKYQEQSQAQFLLLSDNLNQALGQQDLLAQRITQQVDSVTASVYESNTNAFNTMLVTFVVSLIITFVVIFSVVRSIRKPMSKIIAVLEQVSHGDLSGHINIHSQDEFGQIARAVNSVTVQLHDLLADLIASSSGLKKVAQSNSKISEGSEAAFKQQLVEIDSIVAAITEMEASFQAVFTNADQAQSKIADLNAVAAKGQEKMRQNIQTADRLTSQIEESLEVSERLDNASQDISHILKVISDIAEQTNLLALNAAIEAARAGEHGRGFAVVADEVRGLAKRTGESIDQIESLINRLQQDSHAVNKVMQTNVQEIEANVEQVKQVNQAMEQIHLQLGEMSAQSQQIAVATEQQVETAGDVSKRIHAIADVSRVSQESLGELTTIGHELESLADSQQQTTQRFVI